MIVLLLFLQKQNLANAIYRFGLGTLLLSMSRLESVCCLLVVNSISSTPQWKRHCGVEVTEFSTNKQHTHTLYMRCKPVNSRGFAQGFRRVVKRRRVESSAATYSRYSSVRAVIPGPARDSQMLLFIHNCCCLFTIVVTRRSLLSRCADSADMHLCTLQ